MGRSQDEQTATFEREERQPKRSRLWLGRKGQVWRDWLLYLDNRIVDDEGALVPDSEALDDL